MKKVTSIPVSWLGGMVILLLFLLSMEKDLRAAGNSMDAILRRSAAEEFSESLYQNFLPVFSHVQEKRSEINWLSDRQITRIMPLYGYSQKLRKAKMMEEEYLSLDAIQLAEAEEGKGSEDKAAAELEALLTAENAAAVQKAAEIQEAAALGQVNATGGGRTEQEIAVTEKFVPHQLQAGIDTENLESYETLVSLFYTIDTNTAAGSDRLDAAKLSGYDMTIDKGGEGPQILIYHTHSQEAFADSIPGDTNTSIVGAGAELERILKESYGYQVLHHTGQYDVENRNDAYTSALPEIEKLLSENPSIQVVIDLHRDEMPEETKLVMDLDGRPTARFMFFNGLSRTKKTGDISYLYNENLNENLAFSFQMQKAALEYYPGLTRKIYLKGYRYNMHVKPRTLLVELGAQNNTVEEILNACEPLAHLLDIVLSGQ